MEIYIKDLSDITYLSELTQHLFAFILKISNKCWVKFAQIGKRYYGERLTSFYSVSRVLI